MMRGLKEIITEYAAKIGEMKDLLTLFSGQ